MIWCGVRFVKIIFCQFILLFSLFLLLFMDFIELFGITYGFHYTISTNFYLYLQYFQQKVFSFNKIWGSQTDPMGLFGIHLFGKNWKVSLFYYLFYFCYYLWVSLHCLVLFMSPTVLFRPIAFYLQYFQQKNSVSTK